MSEIAIIGGSGVYNLDSVCVKKEHILDTPFGKPSSTVLELEIKAQPFFFLSRHGKDHSISPSEINYRANIYALKKLGVSTVISVSAVGSLKEEYPPSHFVLPGQFMDFTKGTRKRTFFEGGIVGHVSTAYPIEEKLQKRIAEVLRETTINFSVGGTYVCIEGPQFSSRAESDMYRSFGADIIGMTNLPEAYLAKEAGLAYATIGMVTDYDCWRDRHCSVEEIMKVMRENYKSVQELIERLVPELGRNPIKFEPENQYAIVTSPKVISPGKKEILETLIYAKPL